MFLSGREKNTSIDWTTLRSLYRLGINIGETVYIGTLDGADLVMRQLIEPLSKEPSNEETGNRSPSHHHLEVIKNQGFAIDDEERFLVVRCIIAPVFHEDRVIAAVAIAGPNESMKKSLLRGLTSKVIVGSKEIKWSKYVKSLMLNK